MRRGGAGVCDVFPPGLQAQRGLGDGFDALTSAVVKDGDRGAAAVVEAVRGEVLDLPSDVITRALVRRTTLTRQWRLFLGEYAVVLLPVSPELPCPDDLDRPGPDGVDRVWEAQLTLRARACPPFRIPLQRAARRVDRLPRYLSKTFDARHRTVARLPVPLPGDPAPIAHVCYCIPRGAD